MLKKLVPLVFISSVAFSGSTEKWLPLSVDDQIIMIPLSSSIVGTWKTACSYLDIAKLSFQDTIIFREDNTFFMSAEEYSSTDCTGVNTSDEEDFLGTYVIGKTTIAKDGEEAEEIDFNLINNSEGIEGFYMMIRYDSSALMLSDGYTNINSGLTAEERLNDFEGESSIYFRQ